MGFARFQDVARGSQYSLSDRIEADGGFDFSITEPWAYLLETDPFGLVALSGNKRIVVEGSGTQGIEIPLTPTSDIHVRFKLLRVRS